MEKGGRCSGIYDYLLNIIRWRCRRVCGRFCLFLDGRNVARLHNNAWDVVNGGGCCILRNSLMMAMGMITSREDGYGVAICACYYALVAFFSRLLGVDIRNC